MSSPNVSFEQIPSSTRKPGVYTEFNTRMAVRSLPGNLQTTLYVAQKTASGTAPTGVLTNIYSDVDAATQFGYGSQIHRMALKAFKANPYAQISVVALDEGDEATAASWPVTITGAATKAASFYLLLNDDKVGISVATTDTPTSIAAALVAAITAKPELPFTASSLAGVLTLTAKNKGEVANDDKVAISGTVPGMNITVGALVPGELVPDVQPGLTAAFLGGHTQIVMPYRDTDNLMALRDHINLVGNYAEKRWALGFTASTGSLAQAIALSASINHGWISNPWLRNTPTTAMELAAGYAAVIAASEDPALPFDYVEIPGIAAPAVADQTSRTEQESALYNGVTPLQVGPGNVVQIVRAITTYTVNDANVPDVSMLDITTPRTMMYVAKAFVQDRANRYSRAKISDRLMADMRDTGIVLMRQLEQLEIIEAVTDNLPFYIIERDSQDVNRLNERIPVDVVNGLHIIAERFDLLL
jgi:phage tail sheath gpL-like